MKPLKMRTLLRMAMALMTIVLLTGVFLAMRPQQEGASFVEPSDESRSRIHDTLDVTSVRTLTSDAQSVSQIKPEVLPNELFDDDDARLRMLEQGGVALSEIPDALLFLQSLPDQAEVREMRVALIRQWAERDAPPLPGGRKVCRPAAQDGNPSMAWL
jgi:hypothetical protein